MFLTDDEVHVHGKCEPEHHAPELRLGDIEADLVGRRHREVDEQDDLQGKIHRVDPKFAS